MIDRYGVQHQSDGVLGLGLAPEGKWVKYEDYEALLDKAVDLVGELDGDIVAGEFMMILKGIE